MTRLFLRVVCSLFLLPVLLSAQEPVWKLAATIDGSRTPSGPFRDAVAVDVDSEGNLYIVDRARHRLVKYNREHEFIREIGGYGTGAEEFDDPRDVDAHSTLNVFVADYNNDRIVRFDSNLNYLNSFTTDPTGEFHFEQPLSVGVSGQYDIFLLEDLNRRVIKLNRFNETEAVFGEDTDVLGQLLNPHQLCVSSTGKIFVSDPALEAVIVFDYLGNFIREVVHPDLKQPGGISVSSDNTLIVCQWKAMQVYFFRGTKKFSGLLDLSAYQAKPTDAVLYIPRKQSFQILYVLTGQRTLVFTRE